MASTEETQNDICVADVSDSSQDESEASFIFENSEDCDSSHDCDSEEAEEDNDIVFTGRWLPKLPAVLQIDRLCKLAKDPHPVGGSKSGHKPAYVLAHLSSLVRDYLDTGCRTSLQCLVFGGKYVKLDETLLSTLYVLLVCLKINDGDEEMQNILYEEMYEALEKLGSDMEEVDYRTLLYFVRRKKMQLMPELDSLSDDVSCELCTSKTEGTPQDENVEEAECWMKGVPEERRTSCDRDCDEVEKLKSESSSYGIPENSDTQSEILESRMSQDDSWVILDNGSSLERKETV